VAFSAITGRALADDATPHSPGEGPCAKFVAAQRLAPTAGGAIAMGDCFERAGKTGSARAAFDEARVLSRREAADAERRLAALEQRRPTVILIIQDAPGVARGTSIRLDGVPIDPAAVGTPIPAEPGPHLVEVSRGASRWSTQADVGATGAVEITLPAEFAAQDAREVRDAAPEPPPLDQTLASVPPAPPPGPVTPKVQWEAHRISGLTIGIAGVAALVVGAVYGGVAISKKNASNDGPCNAADVCTPTGGELRADAMRAGNISTVALFAGGAAVASGLALFFTAPAARKSIGLSASLTGARLVGSF
jgi:hypothetical protein